MTIFEPDTKKILHQMYRIRYLTYLNVVFFFIFLYQYMSGTGELWIVYLIASGILVPYLALFPTIRYAKRTGKMGLSEEGLVKFNYWLKPALIIPWDELVRLTPDGDKGFFAVLEGVHHNITTIDLGNEEEFYDLLIRFASPHVTVPKFLYNKSNLAKKKVASGTQSD